MRCVVCDAPDASFKDLYCSRECYEKVHKNAKTIGRLIYEERESRGLSLYGLDTNWKIVKCENPECGKEYYFTQGGSAFCCRKCREKVTREELFGKPEKKPDRRPRLDNLTEESIAARKAGLSYGQYTSKKYAPRWDEYEKTMILSDPRYNKGRTDYGY